MPLILLIVCIACAFMAGVEYSYNDTLNYSPGLFVGLLVCSVILGLILIGVLSPEALLID